MSKVKIILFRSFEMYDDYYGGSDQHVIPGQVFEDSSNYLELSEEEYLELTGAIALYNRKRADKDKINYLKLLDINNEKDTLDKMLRSYRKYVEEQEKQKQKRQEREKKAQKTKKLNKIKKLAKELNVSEETVKKMLEEKTQ